MSKQQRAAETTAIKRLKRSINLTKGEAAARAKNQRWKNLNGERSCWARKHWRAFPSSPLLVVSVIDSSTQDVERQKKNRTRVDSIDSIMRINSNVARGKRDRYDLHPRSHLVERSRNNFISITRRWGDKNQSSSCWKQLQFLTTHTWLLARLEHVVEINLIIVGTEKVWECPCGSLRERKSRRTWNCRKRGRLERDGRMLGWLAYRRSLVEKGTMKCGFDSKRGFSRHHELWRAWRGSNVFH